MFLIKTWQTSRFLKKVEKLHRDTEEFYREGPKEDQDSREAYERLVENWRDNTMLLYEGYDKGIRGMSIVEAYQRIKRKLMVVGLIIVSLSDPEQQVPENVMLGYGLREYACLLEPRIDSFLESQEPGVKEYLSRILSP